MARARSARCRARLQPGRGERGPFTAVSGTTGSGRRTVARPAVVWRRVTTRDAGCAPVRPAPAAVRWARSSVHNAGLRSLQRAPVIPMIAWPAIWPAQRGHSGRRSCTVGITHCGSAQVRRMCAARWRMVFIRAWPAHCPALSRPRALPKCGRRTTQGRQPAIGKPQWSRSCALPGLGRGRPGVANRRPGRGGWPVGGATTSAVPFRAAACVSWRAGSPQIRALSSRSCQSR